MSEELKPCPFCGSTSIDYIPETDYQAQAIYCDCPAGVEDNSRTKDELIRFWNTRAEAQKVEKQEGMVRGNNMSKKEMLLGLVGGLGIVAAVLTMQFVLNQSVCNAVGC